MFCRYFFLGLTLIVISTLEARRNISAEDIVNIQYVKSATMSPNGDNIVYELSIPQTKNIRIKSDIEQIKQTKNTYCFFKPCSITKIFCAPIAKIKLKPVKKPSIK